MGRLGRGPVECSVRARGVCGGREMFLEWQVRCEDRWKCF